MPHMLPTARLLFALGAAACALAVPAAARAIPVSQGDVVASYFDFFNWVKHYDAAGSDLGTIYTEPLDVSRGVAVDDRRRVLVQLQGMGLVAIDSIAGTSQVVNAAYHGELEPNATGTVLARASDAISIFDSSTDTFTPLFDPSSSAVLGGAFVRGADILGDGTLVLATSDSIFSLAPGASDVSVLSSGGLLTAQPDAVGFPWAVADVGVTADGRILAATLGRTCESCFFDVVRIVEIDLATGAQSVGLAGAEAGFAGEGGTARLAIGPAGEVYVGRSGPTTNDFAAIARLRANGTSSPIASGETQLLTGLAVVAVPEPSTGLLLAVGLFAVAGARRDRLAA